MTLKTLIAEVHNQQRTLTAIVEQDARTAYFYLWPTDLFRSQYAVRGCWLRNLLPAPAQEDREAMEQGIAPLLSADYCRNPDAEPALDPAGLQVLWEPADDGAALWYYGQLLAVIPGWSLYQDQQVSFSAGCIQPNRLTAPLGSASTNEYYARAVQQRQFWREWHDGSEWERVQQTLMTSYQARVGESVKYYAIDQGCWPPMAISQHWHQGVWYFLTLGMSIRPMPQVDYLFAEQAPCFRRVELGMAVDGEVMTESNAVQMASALAEFAHLPWARLTWLGEGHTLASDVAPVGFDSFLLAQALAPEPASFTLPECEGDTPRLLWATPITEAERHYAQAGTQGGQKLRELLTAGGSDHIFRPRQPVVDAAG